MALSCLPTVLRASVAAALTLGASAASAQADFPNRPVTLIVSAAPGGTTDIAARLIAQPLGAALGQSVVVENKPGASGGIAAQTVARAKADGYTLLLQYSGFQVITPHVTPTAGWDPIKDFAPVANVLSAPQVVVVRPDLPINSLKELVAYAKANPGKLNYASSGNGSLQQVATELLNQMAGTQITHIPYKGTGPALNDLLGGQVSMSFTDILTALPYIKAGKLRPIGLASAQRSDALPDLPTLSEQGLKGYDVSVFFGIVAPKDTPADVVNTLNQAFKTALADPTIAQTLRTQGIVEAQDKTPQGLSSFITTEVPKWRELIQSANVSID
jgi:tripartite-type tricarboxylate transporter receptor subunit TctC